MCPDTIEAFSHRLPSPILPLRNFFILRSCRCGCGELALNFLKQPILEPRLRHSGVALTVPRVGKQTIQIRTFRDRPIRTEKPIDEFRGGLKNRRQHEIECCIGGMF
jgi:hypothetical protein